MFLFVYSYKNFVFHSFVVWFVNDMLLFVGTVGMAWGTGNAVAHRVMDAVMGPRTIKHETVVSEAPPASASPVANSMSSASCDTQSKAFQEVSFKPPLLYRQLSILGWICSFAVHWVIT